MKKISIVLFVLLCYANTFSQSQQPEVFEITTDTLYWQKLDSSYWLILADKEGKWNIDDVEKLYAHGKFSMVNKVSDKNGHVFWITFRVHNDMDRPAKISLNSMSDYDDFYIKPDSGQWQTFKTGKLVDKLSKDGFKSTNCIPITINAGETYIVYERIENKLPGIKESFSVAVLGTDQLLQRYYINPIDYSGHYFGATNLQEVFIIGMIFLAVFMNIFFYRIVNEKVYLYFALFAVFLGINRFYNISGAYLLYKDQTLLPYVRYLSLAWVFILYFLVQFFSAFLNARKHFPVMHNVLTLMTYVFGIVSIIRFTLLMYQNKSLQWLSFISSPVFLLIPLLLIILQFLSLKKSPSTNYYLLAGSLPLLILQVLSQLFGQEGFRLMQGSWISNFVTYNFRLIEAVCLALLLVSITWLLFMRFIDLRKQNAQQSLEKERLAKEKEIERNELIANQKAQLEIEVADRTAALKQSLEELKATQAQLVQSEKMASLGELTAGIAHEIQNPLNFVNNFSEVSAELVEEMNEELDKGDIEEAKFIAADIKQNLEKITHHGKRADAIVKGMLQHSRSSSGQKELTDINALCDEYLKLAYHGWRAKEKSFNADFTTSLDAGISKILIVPQDIGRVLLNLFNNAFYAVNDKKKKAPENYKPVVTVKTKAINDKVEIVISDNGNGIPQNIVNKIFQPFFTTKPTGEGTGLGLSLTYDIIKAHSGEVKVETEEGNGTSFIILLSLQQFV